MWTDLPQPHAALAIVGVGLLVGGAVHLVRRRVRRWMRRWVTPADESDAALPAGFRVTVVDKGDKMA